MFVITNCVSILEQNLPDYIIFPLLKQRVAVKHRAEIEYTKLQIINKS